MIQVKQNGGIWAGGQPEPIEKLYELLETHTLDPMWEEFHGYHAVRHMGGYSFSGNFFNLSNVFNIWVDEDDLAVIQKLEALAQRNMLRPEYERQAFSLYSEHTVVETPTARVLLSPTVMEAWKQGKKHRRLQILGPDPKQATVIGPRFSSADAKRLAA